MLFDAGLPALVRRRGGDLRWSCRAALAGSRAIRCRGGSRSAVAVSAACGARDGADPLARSSGACRCSACPRTRSPSRRCRSLLGLAFVTAGLDAGRAGAGRRARVAERLGRRLHRALRAARRGASRSRRSRGRAARRSRLPASLLRRRLCLAAMADELKPAYLIAGSDRPKVDRAVARLRGRFDADAVELHDAAETHRRGRGRRLQRARALPRATRLVVVEGVEAWKAPDAKAVADVPEGARARDDARARRRRAEEGLAAREGGRGRRASCCSGTSHEGGRRAGSPSSSSCTATKAEPEACRALASSSATTSTSSRARSTSSRPGRAGDEVTAADVEALVAPRAGSPPSPSPTPGARATSAACSRAAERMLDRTGDPRSRTIPRLVGILTSHVAGPAPPAPRGGGHVAAGRRGAARHAIRSRRRSSTRRRGTSAPSELDAALIRLAELDHALKGGSRLAGELELERALVEITAPRAGASEALGGGGRRRAARPATSCARAVFRCSAPRATARSIS